MEISPTNQKIYSKIKDANNILIIVHPNPDADALGSMAALVHLLDNLGKKHTKFCLNQPPDNLAWIVNFEKFASEPSQILKADYDLAIVLDSGDLKYAGVEEIFKNIQKKIFLINIDHHATNNFFGDLNLVETNAVSTTEIIYLLLKSLKIKIEPKTANVILAGIIGDTYNFTNPNTDYKSLEHASELLLLGARIDWIFDSIFKNKTIETLKIWGEIFIGLKYNSDLEIAYTITDFKSFDANVNPTDVSEGVANFLNNITGVRAALILQQLDNETIKGSFRTNNDLIDVSKLARILGGGGHRKAAGFKLKGRIVETDEGWQIV